MTPNLDSASYLGVGDYDLAEQNAIENLPNMVVEAVQPVFFNSVGYPSRIRNLSELFKYTDAMHELAFEDRFSGLLQALTESEFDLVRQLTISVSNFSEERFGQSYLARASIIESLNVFRHIRYLFGDARPRVFEIGPGCGYLGAMLIDQGYPYAATDVSQAFYLYQNHFWNFISQARLNELAKGVDDWEDNQDHASGVATHVPWWKFVQLTPDTSPQFDVIICNHALCEMHPNALGFTLNVARAMLDGGGHAKAFVFHGWGSDRRQSHASVAQQFYRSDFVLTHNDSQITVLAPRTSQSDGAFLHLPSRNKTPLVRLRNFARRLAGSAPRPGYADYDPQLYSSSRNPLSNAIVTNREIDEPLRVIGIERLNNFYTDLIGNEDHNTPDERFLMLANGSRFQAHRTQQI